MTFIKSTLNTTLLAGLLLALFGHACQRPTNPTKTQPPNIVFILIDDLGWSDLPIYGNKFNEAPNISKLAKDGMQYLNAYAACPVCSPSRASIQSGQYPARVGITDFIIGHWRPYEELIVPKNRTQYLPTQIETVAETLKKSGYATGYFGKWHLGFEDEYYPGNQGYDDWRVQRGGTFYNLKSKRGVYPMDDSLTDDQLLSEVLTDYSLNFMEKNKEKPFFLFLSHYDVHVSLDGDKQVISKYLQKEKVPNYPCNAVYAAMIEHIDNSVGRVVNKLETLGLSENTIVVFFSDNGGLVSRFDKKPVHAKSQLGIYEGTDMQYIASSNAPLRAEKGTIYEGGIREPMIVKWPSKIPPGNRSNDLISSIDFYPTFAALAKADLPQNQILDGSNFLNKKNDAAWYEERAIFWHYPVYHHDVPASAVRKGDWKYIEFYNGRPAQLYNLKNDIGEKNNLVANKPEKTAELKQLLAEWKISVDAKIPIPNPDFDESKRAEWGIHPDRSPY